MIKLKGQVLVIQFKRWLILEQKQFDKPLQKGIPEVQEGLEFDAADCQETLLVWGMLLHRVNGDPANKLQLQVLLTIA